MKMQSFALVAGILVSARFPLLRSHIDLNDNSKKGQLNQLTSQTSSFTQFIRNKSSHVVLCKAIIEDGMGYTDWSDWSADWLVTEDNGYFRCTVISSRSAADFHRIVSSYPEQLPTQLLRVELGNGYQFAMYSIVNDTISNHVLRHGTFAPILTAIVTQLSTSCSSDNGEPRLVVDLGCNHGLVSFIALAHGCAAVCVEPSPHLIPLLVRSALRNSFSAPAAILHAAAGDSWQHVRIAGYGPSLPSFPCTPVPPLRAPMFTLQPAAR